MEEFNLWYFLFYLIPESVVMILIISRFLNAKVSLSKITFCSIFIAVTLVFARKYILGYHTLILMFLYIIVIRFLTKQQIVKITMSVMSSCLLLIVIGEIFIRFYSVIIPDFSLVYLSSSDLTIRLMVAWSILIPFSFVSYYLTKKIQFK